MEVPATLEAIMPVASPRTFRRWRSSLVIALIVGLAAIPGSAQAETPPGGVVSDDPIELADLIAGATPDGLTASEHFAPSPRARAAAAPFVGTIHLAGATMEALSDAANGEISNPVLGKDTTFFPDVSLSFFTVKGQLVPTTQDVIRNGVLEGTRSYWDIIVQPGRVWRERGDRAWSRAAFPFALVNSIEGETHNGVALFAYRGREITPVRFQIVQMTSPFYVPEYFTAWGTTDATYERGGVAHLTQRIRRFRAEQRARLPVADWAELGRYAAEPTLDAYTGFADVFQSAVVHNGVLYRTACPTAAGPFPYCDAVRYGVWSVTKSSMMNTAILALAQRYGSSFLDEPIATYMVEAATGGWDTVTYRDLMMMASGHGPDGDPTCYLCDYDRWYVALSEADKTAEALDYPPFAEPGTIFNYRDQDAYLLGVAVDRFAKAKDGRAVWDFLAQEVYEPIGIFHAPTNATVDTTGPGQPLMAYGHYATLDDLAKISLLFQNGGAWNGRQILDADLVAQILPKANPPGGAFDTSGDGTTYYFFDWWHQRLESNEGCAVYVPQMSGWGGITVTLLPGDTVLLRMRNLWIDTPNSQASINALGDELVDMCG